MKFTKATRKKSKLRLLIGGVSGSGKTTAALNIATGLGGKIAVIDTEHGSASLYSDSFNFDSLELEAPYSPERYIQSIAAAAEAGYDVLIIDSMTHEWNGDGGCLQLNDVIAQTKFKGNTWSAWSETTPRHQRFINAILNYPGHVICTSRSKTETAQQDNNGRKTIVKLGTKFEQRDGGEYEFTVVLELSHKEHYADATKDRTRLFTEPFKITEETGKVLSKWLNEGEDDSIQKFEAKYLDGAKNAANGGIEALKEFMDTIPDSQDKKDFRRKHATLLSTIAGVIK